MIFRQFFATGGENGLRFELGFELGRGGINSLMFFSEDGGHLFKFFLLFRYSGDSVAVLGERRNGAKSAFQDTVEVLLCVVHC